MTNKDSKPCIKTIEQTCVHSDRQAYMHAERQARVTIDRQACRPTGTCKDRQADKHV